MTDRRTRCPDGLPLYRVGEIPEHLATKTMLARQRRRPADRQKSVATLFYHGNKHAPLYAIADSVELPALSPARQAAWTAARTCARCQATSDAPLPMTNDERRRCLGCGRAERLAAARPSWLALRQQAVDWARDVLYHPDTVLIALHRLGHGCPIEVHATTVDGQVLVDVLVWPKYPSSKLARTPGAVDADQLVPYLTPLVGRRLIHLGAAWNGTPMRVLSDASNLWWHYETSLADPSIREDRDDAFAQRWTDWHARTWSNGDGLHRGHHNRYGLQHVDVDGDSAAALTAAMRAGLDLMAGDRHPDGPPACPWLPPTGITPCGARPWLNGLCRAHGGDVDQEARPVANDRTSEGA
ncbi:hypothetical protein [Micromonospora sp. CB01531]|uniref:hypothetical protein n=1 Tax=Micromonospora sp. CB01531 TaxID=1718947 RepID=UPI00093C147C|nr:hypothetical protein [Micromonospora sp. CB01531]OKI52870.1 hypothetical protein A6A27_08255 [Micromonospora sp. CB01531]